MLTVLQQLHAVVPGSHLGDNVASLWNTWWFAWAIERGEPVYRTTMLFAPAGTQLSLHTHATTHSVLAWPLAATGRLLAGHNLAVALGLVLNGLCTGLLAFRFTRALLPSLAAGLVFSLSAYVQVHALGHVNLLHAWVLPLFAYALIRLPSAGVPGALACGAASALVVYTDYYYAVYAAIFALAWTAGRRYGLGIRRAAPRAPRLRTVLLVLIFIDALVILAVVLTGGTVIDVGIARVSMRGLRNPSTAFWILLLAWVLARFPVSVSLWRQSGGEISLRRVMVSLATMLVLTSPLLVALAGVLAAGDYSTQEVRWRSSPPGADLLTMALGHPRHLLWGEATQSAYGSLGIDLMEQSLYLGIVPLLLVLCRAHAWLRIDYARGWLAIGVVFFALSLGPFLRVAGRDTALPLPQALLRYVPVLSNARIPGRAVVMVQLSLAMLTAHALAGLSRRRWLPLTLTAVIAFELLPAPLPAQRVPPPDAVDAYLARQDDGGAVAEVPLGLRDGFGEAGRFDHRALGHQLWHERPLVGGFVARLPTSVRAAQLGSPPIALLLEASTTDGTPVELTPGFALALATAGVRYVVVNRDTFVSERLPRAALEAAGLTLVTTAATRELYSTGLQ